MLSKKTIVKLLPEIDKRKISLVARGKRRSTATKGGFLQHYYFGDIDTLATKNQTWRERRKDFIARHLGGRGGLWLKNGHPSRKHLALVAWAYTPDPKGLQDYIKATKAKNKDVRPYIKPLTKK
jgi:predicted KAP-like P-loop ATPase